MRWSMEWNPGEIIIWLAAEWEGRLRWDSKSGRNAFLGCGCGTSMLFPLLIDLPKVGLCGCGWICQCRVASYGRRICCCQLTDPCLRYKKSARCIHLHDILRTQSPVEITRVDIRAWMESNHNQLKAESGWMCIDQQSPLSGLSSDSSMPFHGSVRVVLGCGVYIPVSHLTKHGR